MSIYEETLIGVLENTREKMPEHYNTLWGERKAGSKWNLELTRPMISEWEWELVEDNGPVKIYQAYLSQLNLMFSLNVKALGDLTEDERKQIIIRYGAHGPELVVESGNEVSDIPTNIATLIIGPHEDIGDIVYTIHPGNPMPPHGCENVKQLRNKYEGGMLSPETAVKCE
jgi:hypothetical protein